VAINTFTWRYQIILAILLPPAGALGLTAVLGRRVWPQPVAEGERRYPAPGQPEPV
jgi:hypothetical protein